MSEFVWGYGDILKKKKIPYGAATLNLTNINVQYLELGKNMIVYILASVGIQNLAQFVKVIQTFLNSLIFSNLRNKKILKITKYFILFS